MTKESRIKRWLEQGMTLDLPVVGSEYTLFLGLGPYAQEKKVDAVYLGHKKSGNIWFKEKRPEGHIFGRIDDKFGLILYSIRDNNKYLQETWMSDGHDGPDWPVGFGAREIDKGIVSQSNIERITRYLTDLRMSKLQQMEVHAI